MVLCHPGQIKPFKKFKASIYVLKKEEGGRHTPFGNKYRPQFYLRTMDCTGEITLPAGVEMVMPGDNVEITVELIYAVALNPGLRFAIREGGRTVGSGQIMGGGLLTGIAQLVEHRSPKPRVVGSSPPSRANNIDYVEEDCRLLQGLL